MVVRVTNAQRQTPVNVARMRMLAQRAVKRLAIEEKGELAITFINDRRMRRLNHRFLRHDRPTDVLSFRYEGEPVAGEILIAPQQARRYANAHHIPYALELSRYLVHGLLHWLGYEDRTRVQRHRMRVLEETLLAACGVKATG